MRLVKYHGLGNDYLVLATGERMDPVGVQRICARHRGVGADGVLEPMASHAADYGLRIWNPDGSTAEKSGNGLRIFARWLRDRRGAPAAFSIEVGGGVVRCWVEGPEGGGQVIVEMGEARFEPEHVPVTRSLIHTDCRVGDATLALTAVGLGNPHCVSFFDDGCDLDELPWRAWGALLETHALFPNRTNVQFATIRQRGEVEVRVWERGAGETQASGSSACAVVAAGVLLERLDRQVEVKMPGGGLFVEVFDGMNLRLRGPVALICEVELGVLLSLD